MLNYTTLHQKQCARGALYIRYHIFFVVGFIYPCWKHTARIYHPNAAAALLSVPLRTAWSFAAPNDLCHAVIYCFAAL